MDAIGRRTGMLISAGDVGKLLNLPAGNVHDKDIKVSRFVSTSPRKRNVLAVGAPRGVDRVTLPGGQARNVSSINTHSIYLRRAAAPGDKDDVRTGLGVHLGLHFQGSRVREGAQTRAIDVGDVNLRESAGGAVNEKVAAVGHEIGGGAQGGLLVVVDQLSSGFERMHEDLGLTLGSPASVGGAADRISGKRDSGSVGGYGGEIGNGSVGGKLLLVRAVVVHGPDFLVAGPVGNEVEFGSHEADTTEELQNVGGELLRHSLRASLVEGADVSLSDDLSGGCVGLRDVVQPSVQDDLIVLNRGVSEGQVVGAHGRRGPIGEPYPLLA